MQSEMIQGSTGSVTLFISTESFVDSPLQERNTGVSAERGTCTTRPDLPGGQLGRGTPPSPFDATVDRHDFDGVCIGVSFIFCSRNLAGRDYQSVFTFETELSCCSQAVKFWIFHQINVGYHPCIHGLSQWL